MTSSGRRFGDASDEAPTVEPESPLPRSPITWLRLIVWSCSGTIVYHVFGHAAVWPSGYLPAVVARATTEVFDTVMTFFALVAAVGGVVLVPFSIFACFFSVVVRKEGLDAALRWYHFAKPCITLPIAVYLNYWAQLEIREEAYGRAVARGEPLVEAIEEYAIAHEGYPGSLQALVPGHIDAIPDTNLAGFPAFSYWRYEARPIEAGRPLPDHAKLWINAQWKLGFNGELARVFGADIESALNIDRNDYEAYPGWHYID